MMEFFFRNFKFQCDISRNHVTFWKRDDIFSSSTRSFENSLLDSFFFKDYLSVWFNTNIFFTFFLSFFLKFNFHFTEHMFLNKCSKRTSNVEIKTDIFVIYKCKSKKMYSKFEMYYQVAEIVGPSLAFERKCWIMVGLVCQQ